MRILSLTRGLKGGLRVAPVWYFALFSCLIVSCGISDSAQTEAHSPNAAKAKKPKPPAPLKLRVVVPYGGNMPGFMNYRALIGAPKTEFQQRIGSLLTAVGKAPHQHVTAAFFTTNDAGSLTPSSYADLSALVDGTKPRPTYAPGIAIPPLLADATAAADSSDAVTLLVTDLTHNGGDKKSVAALPSDVTAALIGKKGAVAFSVYAEPSHFVGTYFPALRGAAKRGTTTTIPYYIWLIGSPAQVSRAAREFLPNPPERQTHVGLTYSNVAAGALLTRLPAGSKLESSGGGSVWEQGKEVAIQNASEGVEFSVGLDLRELPTAWQDPAFLNASLRVQLTNGTVTLIPQSVRRLTAAECATSTTLKPYSHTARIKVTKLAPNTSTLTFSLPAPELPAWPDAWTSTNNQPPGLTTYRLKQVLEGARQAHGAEALPPVLSVSLSLINQD